MGFTKDDLKNKGYKGFVTISEIKNYFFYNKNIGIKIPNKQGVYMILLPNLSNKFQFSEKSKGGHFKNKNPTVDIDILNNNRVKDAEVLYIGKAGGKKIKTKLEHRLKQYMRFGSNKKVSHWGGRYIWQLNNSDDLIVIWKTTLGDEPHSVESQLIKEFKDQFGKLPFANLRK